MKTNSNYHISGAKIGGRKIIYTEHIGQKTRFSIIPDYGACLNDLMIRGRPILWSARSEEELTQRTIGAFSGAQLFPFPNRVKNAQYFYDGKKLILPVNDFPRANALHGLVYNRSFDQGLLDKENGKVSFSYNYRSDHPGFPFNAHLKNTFQLNEHSLTIDTCILNNGNTQFPFGHGWHPYFLTPSGVGDYFLKIPGKISFELDENLIPNRRMAKMDYFSNYNKIGNLDLNHCFLLNKQSGLSEISLVSPNKKIEIRFELRGYEFLQVLHLQIEILSR